MKKINNANTGKNSNQILFRFLTRGGVKFFMILLFFCLFQKTFAQTQNCQWGDFHFNTPLNQLPQNEILVFGANSTPDVRLIHNIEGEDEYYNCNGVQEATSLSLCIANRLINATFKVRVVLRIAPRNGNSPFNIGDFEIVNSNIPFHSSLINGGYVMESDEIKLDIQSLTRLLITFKYVGINNPNARNEQHTFVSEIQELIPFAQPILITNNSLFLQRNIAAKCPTVSGASVYIARILLPLCEQSTYDDLNNCIAQIPAGKVIQTSNNTTLYPNPASNEVIISLPSTIKIEVKVIDLNGRVVYQNNLQDSDVLTINTSAFANGIYFVQFSDAKLPQQKLIIQH
jgi:hypothetical protein